MEHRVPWPAGEVGFGREVKNGDKVILSRSTSLRAANDDDDSVPVTDNVPCRQLLPCMPSSFTHKGRRCRRHPWRITS